MSRVARKAGDEIASNQSGMYERAKRYANEEKPDHTPHARAGYATIVAYLTSNSQFSSSECRVMLWGNTIMRIDENDTLHLSAEGWYSKTTKDRLNAFTPEEMKIFQRKERWYFQRGPRVYPFVDCMVVTPVSDQTDGTVPANMRGVFYPDGCTPLPYVLLPDTGRLTAAHFRELNAIPYSPKEE